MFSKLICFLSPLFWLLPHAENVDILSTSSRCYEVNIQFLFSLFDGSLDASDPLASLTSVSLLFHTEIMLLFLFVLALLPMVITILYIERLVTLMMHDHDISFSFNFNYFCIYYHKILLLFFVYFISCNLL